MQNNTNSITELSFKAIILGIILAALMAISNTFLALKIGVLTASSIPAAILSMGILRLFRSHTILENNIVQTCASAGEAIAGGIVYTAPGLIILHAWHNFPYWQSAAIALLGGLLGIVITIPLRKSYMQNPELKFPEAQAISQVLLAGQKSEMSIKPMLLGGMLGAIMEIAQNSFRWLSPAFDWWITKGTTTFGIGIGFSATLLGAGYLMGFSVGVSILIGAIIGHIIGVPTYTSLMHASYNQATDALRYMGIAAMLAAGVITLIQLLKPLYNSMKNNIKGLSMAQDGLLRTEYDAPNYILVIALLCLLFLAYLIYNITFIIPLDVAQHQIFIVLSIIFTVLISVIFASMCAYFSGLVGVAASPGSAVAIASVLIAGTILRALLSSTHNGISHAEIIAAEAIVMIIASVIMGSACVANNNSQDLKVGHIVGATPWKQQLMLAIGVTVAAAIVPLIMQLLYQAYGIADVMPHAGMDPNASLSAPPAAAMAAITSSIFNQHLPYHIMIIGVAILAVIYAINLLSAKRVTISLIGVAIGMYLPLDSSTPLFIGALVSYLVAKRHNKLEIKTDNMGTTIACGLVAGAAITNVILAVPLALMKHPIAASSHTVLSNLLAALATVIIALFMYFNARDNS